MNQNEIKTMLGLAFLENHPRLEVLQNLARIAEKLEDEPMRLLILNVAERIYLPNTAQLAPNSQDEIFIVLYNFCVHCHQETFLTMQDHNFRAVHGQMEQIMLVQEEAWRKNRRSSATAAANTALDWLGESMIGRNLSVAERAVLRGLFVRRQHLRGS